MASGEVAGRQRKLDISVVDRIDRASVRVGEGHGGAGAVYHPLPRCVAQADNPTSSCSATTKQRRGLPRSIGSMDSKRTRSRRRLSPPMGRAGRATTGWPWRIRSRCWASPSTRLPSSSDAATGSLWLAITRIGQRPTRRSNARRRMTAWPASRPRSACSTIRTNWSASGGWNVLGNEGAARRSLAATECTSGRRTRLLGVGSNRPRAIPISTTAPARRASSR